MGAPQQQRKVLRIGIIQGGRITEERLIRFGETVTIGDGMKNTFVLHSLGLPDRFPIFIFKNNQYTLAFRSDMDGRISMDGGVVMNFDKMREKSAAQKDGSFLFPLTEQVRGKVTISGTTILFQFVAPPPITKNAQKEFTVSAIKQVDPIYWSMVAISFILHTSLVLYAMSLPSPKEPTLEEIEDKFAKFIVPQKVEAAKVEEKKAGEGEKKAEEKKETKKEEKKEEAKKDPADSAPKPQISEEQRKAIRKAELSKKGILGLLATRGASGVNGATQDVLTGNRDNFDLSEVLKSGGGGMAVATQGTLGGLRGGKGVDGPDVGDVGSLDAKAEVTTKKHVSVKPRVDTAPIDTTGNVDKATIDKVVKQNVGGVQACYERALKLNPDLHGKIYIEFTVETTGKVSSISIRGEGAQDSDMENCIKSRVRNWRFPANEEGPSDISIPIVLSATQ